MYTVQIKVVTSIVSISLVSLLLIGMPTAVHAQDGSELHQQLARVRAATAKYHDLNNALEDGYVLLLPSTCNEDSNGAGGIHYTKASRFVSPVRLPEEPDLLVYIPTGDGNLRLVGVEYATRALYRDTRPPDTPGYRPGEFPWQQFVIPPYLEEVSGPFTLFGQQSRGPIFFGRWLYYLHAWVWAPNPNGMFADGNPRLSCTPIE